MRDPWFQLVDTVLRPSRSELQRCLRERERHVAAERIASDERASALTQCRSEIENLRAFVFATGDGVVSADMTELERQWVRLSRTDRDGRMMDLWARIAPPHWVDRKRWRDSEVERQLEAAIALAADVDGVEAAESALAKLQSVLAGWGTRLGSRIRWRALPQDFDGTTALLEEPLRRAREALVGRDIHAVALERAAELQREIAEAARARLPEHPLLAQGLAHAAFVDYLFRAASLSAPQNPVTALRELWATGYALSALDSDGVTLAIPPL